jgi:hypothetical protein
LGAAVRLEQGLKVLLGSGEGQVPDVKSLAHLGPFPAGLRREGTLLAAHKIPGREGSVVRQPSPDATKPAQQVLNNASTHDTGPRL